MSTDENKRIISLLFEQGLNQGNLAIVDEVFSPLFIDHSAPDQVPGIAGVKAYFTEVRQGFPDMHVTIDDLIAVDEKVVVRTTWRGTHSGVYEGVPSTGRRVKRTLIQIFILRDGKIQAEWNEGAGLLA